MEVTTEKVKGKREIHRLPTTRITTTGDPELDAVTLIVKAANTIFDELNLDEQARQRAWSYIDRRMSDTVYAASRERAKAEREHKGTVGMNLFGGY